MKFISVHSHDADSEIELFKSPRSVLSFDSMIAEPASLRFRRYQSLVTESESLNQNRQKLQQKL